MHVGKGEVVVRVTTPINRTDGRISEHSDRRGRSEETLECPVN